MNARSKRRLAAEEAALQALRKTGTDWVSSKGLASVNDMPWRSTARALLRLVAAGKLRERIQAWRDLDYRLRFTRQYRCESEQADPAEWPDWMSGRMRRLPPR